MKNKYRQIPLILLLAFCLCLPAGCGPREVLHDIAVQLDGAADSPSDAGPVTEPETPQETFAEPVSDTDALRDDDPPVLPQQPAEEPAADLAGLSLAECVTDADGAAGQLPRIVPSCPGADAINEDIEGTFRYLVDADYCTLYYTASKNGPILSVMIAQNYDGEASYYTPYMLDLSTGERLSGQELLEKMGLGADTAAAAELAVMGQEFEYQYGAESQGENADFYREQYERTVSADNAELSRLWLDDEGELIPMQKVRGRKKSIEALFNIMRETAAKPVENQVVFISHGDCIEDVEYLEKLIQDGLHPKKIVHTVLDPVIGAHAGPGTVALFFLSDHR